jgi:hypothetical protein
VTAEARLAGVLVGSFLLWLPALSSLLQGTLEPGVAGQRLAGAVVLAWVSTTLLGHLLRGSQPATEEPATDTDGPQEPLGRRREEDVPTTMSPTAPEDEDRRDGETFEP